MVKLFKNVGRKVAYALKKQLTFCFIMITANKKDE